MAKVHPSHEWHLNLRDSFHCSFKRQEKNPYAFIKKTPLRAHVKISQAIWPPIHPAWPALLLLEIRQVLHHFCALAVGRKGDPSLQVILSRTLISSLQNTSVEQHLFQRMFFGLQFPQGNLRTAALSTAPHKFGSLYLKPLTRRTRFCEGRQR